MKNFGLFFPTDRPNAVEAAGRVAAKLRSMGENVYVEHGSGDSISEALPLATDTQLDAVFTLGGDGTFLRGATYAAVRNLPVLGINLGTTGFLTETEPADMEEAIRAVAEGQYWIEERPMVRMETSGGAGGIGLNDVSITRGGYGRLISIQVIVDGELAGEYRGDGLVVATPTGSTGYSLSAGGPILAPGVHGMVITPICSHSLQNRPVVVAGRSQIELIVGRKEEMTAVVQMDGRTVSTLHKGEKVRIYRPDETVRMIRLKPSRFFTIVQQKLVEWST